MGNYKELRPIRFPPELEKEVEDELSRVFREEIYLPLVKIVKQNPRDILSNAKEGTDVLLDAIKSGRIYFYRGQFRGDFNSLISKELRRLGAVWNSGTGTFNIQAAQLSDPIKLAINNSQTTFEKMLIRLEAKLSQILPAKIAEKIQIQKIFEKVIYKVDKEVEDTLKGTKRIREEAKRNLSTDEIDQSSISPSTPPTLPASDTDGVPVIPQPAQTTQLPKSFVEQVVIQPKFTPEQVTKIAEEYTENMKMYIKGWTEENIIKLREEIKQNTLEGKRFEGIVSAIENNYGVSQSKAKFLARQETNLLATKLKETRYLDAGVTEYRWVCVKGSPAHPVRPMHKKLDGTVHSWNNPPIVDQKGNRKNPGEDFNCRCVAKPIVRF